MKPGNLLFTATLLCILQMPVMAETETSIETEPTVAPMETFTETEPAMAPTETSTETEQAMTEEEADTTIGNFLPELVFRPVGLLSSAAGVGFYIASLPFAAVANLLEPHDALEFTYESFILTPFTFTFLRPIGDYSVNIEGTTGAEGI